MQIKPLSNHILVEPQKDETLTKSGILLPDTTEKDPEQGKVIAVGPGKKDKTGKAVPLEVKAGDNILFAKYAPNKVKVNNKEYLILSEEDILAILE